MTERRRWAGDEQKVLKIMKEEVKGPCFLRYAEMPGAAVDAKGIKRHKLLIAKLAALQPNLSFKQTDLERIFLELLEDNLDWDVQEQERKAWATTMAKRVRVLLRHVANATGRKVQPKWVSELGLDTIAEGRDDRKAAGTSDGGADADFLYMWDNEARQAYRQKPGGRQQWSKRMVKPDNGGTFMIAEFADGSLAEITGITLEAYAEQEISQADAASRPSVLWKKVHEASSLVCHVAQRADRNPLMSLYWGGKQVCQVNIKRLGDDIEKASKLMISVGEEFVAGKVPQKDLFKTRDNLAKQMFGVAIKGKGMKIAKAGQILKRPAAQHSEETEPPTTPMKRPMASPQTYANVDSPKQVQAGSKFRKNSRISSQLFVG